MQTREQYREALQYLLGEIIQFNKSNHNDYESLCRDIKQSYSFNEYTEMLAHMREACDNLGNNIEAINELPDGDLIIVGQYLKDTADFIGLDTRGIEINNAGERIREEGLPIFYYNSLSSQTELFWKNLKKHRLFR